MAKPGILATVNKFLPKRAGASERVNAWRAKLQQGQQAYSEIAETLEWLDNLMGSPFFEYALHENNRDDIFEYLRGLQKLIREGQEVE